MSNKPKRQHYLPVFYLKGFLNDKNEKLNVLNQKTGEEFKLLPKNIALEKNLYTLENDINSDVDKYCIENLLSNFEGLVAPIINEINETKVLPDGEDLTILINFVALMGCKSQ
jgi:hypothetical protein